MNRRDAMRVLACAAAMVLARESVAEAQSDPTAPVRAFYDALLGVMKRAKTLGVRGRYDALAPVIRKAFDLPAMTRIAVGPRWTSIPADQQSALVDAFSRMTIATYANRFDGYSGERFEVETNVDARGSGSVVHTRIVQPKGEPVTINYLMRKSGGDWKIVDVYLTGTISELATRRSEFGSILDTGGPKALIGSLTQQADRLLQPAPSS
ncbi:MAG TPA: ABC transporter substrate-binding protein [Casimicrobiaceae bacterium]|nr:ABC transporter substrate-binding protein [Casimicrobiaceae bacterium]